MMKKICKICGQEFNAIQRTEVYCHTLCAIEGEKINRELRKKKKELNIGPSTLRLIGDIKNYNYKNVTATEVTMAIEEGKRIERERIRVIVNKLLATAKIAGEMDSNKRSKNKKKRIVGAKIALEEVLKNI